MKKEYVRKPQKCPSCKSEKVASILYGMPNITEKLQRDLDEGRVILGGCAMDIEEPYWQCVDCEMTLFKKASKPKLNEWGHESDCV